METTLTPKASAFVKKITSSFWVQLFFIKSLPLAWIVGLRVKHLDANSCTVSVPYKYWNKNPFQSMYFAVQAMAGELSTGALMILSIQNSTAQVSMLVVDFKGNFTKKATSRIFFTCQDGPRIQEAIAKTIATGEGVVVKTTTVGSTLQGEEVSRFEVTWSVKRKS